MIKIHGVIVFLHEAGAGLSPGTGAMNHKDRHEDARIVRYKSPQSAVYSMQFPLYASVTQSEMKWSEESPEGNCRVKPAGETRSNYGEILRAAPSE